MMMMMLNMVVVIWMMMMMMLNMVAVIWMMMMMMMKMYYDDYCDVDYGGGDMDDDDY